jgi:glycosyltransferase involved in cell wall biosynthesis
MGRPAQRVHARSPAPMLKILVLTRYDRLGASSRVRFLQFLTALGGHGMSFSVKPFLDNDYISGLYRGERTRVGKVLGAYLRRFCVLLFRRKYDLVWMEKEALPWLPATIELALMRGTPYVVDFDDAWFHRYDQNPAPIVRGLMAGKIDAVMRHAAVVVAGNEYLADRARHAAARRIQIIPSVIDFNRHMPGVISNIGRVSRNIPVVIGWIGTPLTARYLSGIEQAFRAIAALRSVELQVVGASAPAAFFGLPVKHIVWNEATEIETIRAFDIGIMPLDNTVWERGKCAYKLLQVMAAGRPVVASPVGANCTVIQDGINGFLADTPDRWIEVLIALIDDPNLRVRIGLEALQTVKDRYTIERVLPELASLLTEASVLRN